MEDRAISNTLERIGFVLQSFLHLIYEKHMQMVNKICFYYLNIRNKDCGIFIIEYSHSSGGDTFSYSRNKGSQREHEGQWRDFSGAKGSLRD